MLSKSLPTEATISYFLNFPAGRPMSERFCILLPKFFLKFVFFRKGANYGGQILLRDVRHQTYRGFWSIQVRNKSRTKRNISPSNARYMIIHKNTKSTFSKINSARTSRRVQAWRRQALNFARWLNQDKTHINKIPNCK